MTNKERKNFIKYLLISVFIVTLASIIYFYVSGFLMTYASFYAQTNLGIKKYLEYVFLKIIATPLGWLGLLVVLFALYIYNPKKMKQFEEKEKRENALEISDDKCLKYNINKEKIKERLFNKFLEIESIWQQEDSVNLQFLVSEEVYNKYNEEINKSKISKRKEILKDITLKDSKLLDIKEKYGFLFININLKVLAYNYIINENGILIYGYPNEKVEIEYMLTFKSFTSVEKCPNCAALLENKTICNYCGSFIESDYILEKLERITER